MRFLVLCALAALLSTFGGCNHDGSVPLQGPSSAEVESAHKQVAESQTTALAAVERAKSAEAAVAAAKGALLTATLQQHQAEKDAQKASDEAAVAPLRAVLKVAEWMAVVAIILGVVEIVATFVWTVPIGRKLGEFMIGAGAAVLVVSGWLEGALSHAYVILFLIGAAFSVYGYVWLQRTGKLVGLSVAAHTALVDAEGVLRSLGHHAEADSLRAMHYIRTATIGVEGWADRILAKLHLVKPSAPAQPAAPVPPPAPKV